MARRIDPTGSGVASGVEVVELGAGARPGRLEEAASAGHGDVGRAQVVATEADVGREEVAGGEEVDQLALRRHRADTAVDQRGDDDVAVAVDGEGVEQLEAR